MDYKQRPLPLMLNHDQNDQFLPIAPSAIVVRDARHNEADLLASIDYACLSDNWTRKRYARAMQNRTTEFVVAQCRNIVPAMAVFERSNGRAHIKRFAVLSVCRRHGIGRALMESIKDYAVRFRLRGILITIDEMSVGSQLFLRSVGLKCDVPVPGLFDVKQDDGTVVHNDGMIFRWNNPVYKAVS